MSTSRIVWITESLRKDRIRNMKNQYAIKMQLRLKLYLLLLGILVEFVHALMNKIALQRLAVKGAFKCVYCLARKRQLITQSLSH